jgi:pectate lyase
MEWPLSGGRWTCIATSLVLFGLSIMGLAQGCDSGGTDWLLLQSPVPTMGDGEVLGYHPEDPQNPSPLLPSEAGNPPQVPAGAGMDPVVNEPSARPGRAFPSAEGFGAAATGGRGGRVVYVSTLEDYSIEAGEQPIQGSLRWTLEELQGPRTVVFGVGGTIWLKQDLWLAGSSGSYVTVAGQTAPGDGIQLAGFGLQIRDGAHDVIVRYLRIRPGVTSEQTWIDPDGENGPLPPYLETWDMDAVLVYGGNNTTTYNVIVDHCSLEWAFDEDGSVWDHTYRVTFQYCIFGAGASFGHYGDPAAYPYDHSCGFLAGGRDSSSRDDYLTLHHNLFIGNSYRNPLLKDQGGRIDFVNNVLYSWKDYATELRGNQSTGATSTLPSLRLNFVGNWYQEGPTTLFTDSRRSISMPDLDDQSLYMSDNAQTWDFNPDGDPWQVVFNGFAPLQPVSTTKRRMQGWPVLTGIPVTIESASGLKATLKSRVGANLPTLDAVDARLIAALTDGTDDVWFGSLYNHETHPVMKGATSPRDTDGDGMPDDWEVGQGLDPDDPGDGQSDPDGDGYTNLEEYLNDLAGEK